MMENNLKCELCGNDERVRDISIIQDYHEGDEHNLGSCNICYLCLNKIVGFLKLEK